MARHRWGWGAVATLLGLLLWVGCGGGDDDTPDPDSATDDQHNGPSDGPGPSGGDDAGKPASGGPTGSGIDPNTIPTQFDALDSAACGSLGEACGFATGVSCDGTTCNLGVNVCLPTPMGSFLLCRPGNCSPDKPYCIGGQCLDLEEASCVCGRANITAVPECAAPAIAALGAKRKPDGSVCLERSGPCDGPYGCCAGLDCRADDTSRKLCQAPCGNEGETCGSTIACCDTTALTCLKFASDPDFQCYPRCETDGDCGDGCCQEIDSGPDGVCRDAATCAATACVEDGNVCGMGKGCCTGLTCVTQAGADTGTCAPSCMEDDDCPSGCCKRFASSPGGYCDDAVQCMCIPTDDACGGPNTRTCCEGTRCVGATGAAFCRKECTTADDCGGNCCRPVTGGGNSVCDVGPC